MCCGICALKGSVALPCQGGLRSAWKLNTLGITVPWSQTTIGANGRLRTSAECGTHVSAPDVGGEDLVLLVQVEDLDEREPVAHPHRLGRVVDRPPDQPHLLVVLQQMLDEALLVRHGQSSCGREDGETPSERLSERRGETEGQSERNGQRDSQEDW